LSRVVNIGGSAFITVPFLEAKEETLIRATMNANGEIEPFLPPEYHGDPVNVNEGYLLQW
jgi:hypothetical protein